MYDSEVSIDRRGFRIDGVTPDVPATVNSRPGPVLDERPIAESVCETVWTKTMHPVSPNCELVEGGLGI